MKKFLLSSWHSVTTTLAMTVGSPSIDRRGTMLKPLFLAMLFLLCGVGNAWGAVGDAITAHGSIADATVYYLAGEATVSSKKNTYYSVLASDAASASVTGNATTTQASGTKYTFLIESSAYYLVTPNGYYVEPHGSSNGKLILTTEKKAVTVSTVSSKIRITGTTNTGKSIQKNKTTNANFGSYGNTQNDLTLYVAGYRVIYDANGATGGTVPTDNTVYGDNASATIKANTGTLVKTGYTFAGWNTAANGSGTDVAATGSASKTITAGLRLYAKWTAAAPSYTITPASNNTNYGTVSLSGSVITATPAANCRIASDAYTVTSGTASVERGTGDNINKFTVTPSANCTVRINFEQIPTHTVTWSANGTTTSETYQEGASITFPNNATGCDGGTFIGWASATISGTQATAPTLVTSATMGNSDITYYAVFATASGSGATTYTLTPAASVTAGTYVIAALKSTTASSTYYAATGGINSGDMTVESTGFTLTNNAFSTLPTGACEFTFTGDNSSGFSINNGSGNLYFTASNNRKLAFQENNTTKWIVYAHNNSLNTGGVYIQNTTNNNTYTLYENSTGDDPIRGYYNSSNTYRAIYLFKKSGGTTYSDYRTTCCTELGSINGSFFWSTLFEPLSPDKFRSHVLLCDHLFSSSHSRILHHLIYTMYISRDFGFF